MKLSLKAVAVTAGLTWAGYIFLVGIANLAYPQYGAGFLALISSIYPGLTFAHQWENVALRTFYGFVDGAIGGLLFAWIYDYMVSRTHSNKRSA